jgi:hypothetical protein
MTTKTADKGEGAVLPSGPRAAGQGLSRPAAADLLDSADQPPLTRWTPAIVPCAVCKAELTDEVPVIAAWIAVQMACDTFG